MTSLLVSTCTPWDFACSSQLNSADICNRSILWKVKPRRQNLESMRAKNQLNVIYLHTTYFVIPHCLLMKSTNCLKINPLWPMAVWITAWPENMHTIWVALPRNCLSGWWLFSMQGSRGLGVIISQCDMRSSDDNLSFTQLSNIKNEMSHT